MLPQSLPWQRRSPQVRSAPFPYHPPPAWHSSAAPGPPTPSHSHLGSPLQNLANGVALPAGASKSFLGVEAEDKVDDDDAHMSTDVTKRPIPPGHEAGVHTSDSQSLSESLTAALATALSAAAAYPERQVVQCPTPELMVAYFKKHLQRHMTASGVAGTEDLSLSAACRALEQHCPSCTLNAHDLVAKAMEELRLEAERGEEKSEEELAWILSYTIALQHMHEHNE